MENIKKLIIDKSSKPSEEEVLEALAKDVLGGLNVDLVSIWYFNDDHTDLTCKYSIDKNNKFELKDSVLLKQDYPLYFNAIIESISLKAEDVYSHPKTTELIDGYLRPFGTVSLLDYLIYERGKTTGVISCETTSEKRVWLDKDIDLMRVLTVMAGVELKNAREN